MDAARSNQIWTRRGASKYGRGERQPNMVAAWRLEAAVLPNMAIASGPIMVKETREAAGGP